MKKMTDIHPVRWGFLSLAAAGLLFVVGCSDTDTGEDLGDAFDETVEDAADAIEESRDGARDWFEDQREEEGDREQYEDDPYDEQRDGDPIRFD